MYWKSGKLALLSLVAPASAVVPASVEQTSDWVLEAEPIHCRITAQAGTSNPVLLEWTQVLPYDSPKVRIVSERWKLKSSKSEADVQITFVPEPSVREYKADVIRINGGGMGVQFFVKDPSIDKMDNFSALYFKLTDNEPVTIVLPEASAFRSLAACTLKLFESFGGDPASYKTMRTKPTSIGNPGIWCTLDDLHAVKDRGLGQGTATARFMIRIDGKIEDCAVVSPGVTPELAASICNRLVERARYRPAIGIDGVAFPLMGTRRIQWWGADRRIR